MPIAMTLIRALSWIAERQGNGQNAAPTGGGGGVGGGGGGGFFLFALLFAGHGAGLVVLLVLGAGYLLFGAWASRTGRGGGGGFGALGGILGVFGPGGSAGRIGGDPPPIPASGRRPGPSDGTPQTAQEAAAYGGHRTATEGGYDDSHPVGVPTRFRGAMLEGSSAAAAGPVDDIGSGLAAIRTHDPAFEAEAFIAAAQTSFFTIQQAWMECRPEMSRAVMADGLAQQTAMQLEEYRRDNRRNRLDGLTVADARVLGAHSDGVYDTVTVRFTAASSDYDVDATSGRVVRGHRDIESWTEDWVFQRSSNAVTKPAGLMSHQCPNCQAPISVNAQGVCEYCGKTVMSGQYDWVLSRIEQVDVSVGGGYASGW